MNFKYLTSYKFIALAIFAVALALILQGQTSAQLIDPGGGGGDSASQEETIATEYLERQNVDQRLQTHGIDLMGERVDLNTGAVSFEHTDVSIPGNSSLQVAIRRKRSQGFPFAHLDSTTVYTGSEQTNRRFTNDFSDWELDVPFVEFVVPQDYNVNSAQGGFCEAASQAYTVYVFPPAFPQYGPTHPNLNDAVLYEPSDVSNGIDMNIPGVGRQKIIDNPGGIGWPSGTNKATKDYWAVECGDLGAGDEGFRATSPNGTVYDFDLVVNRPEVAIPVTRTAQQGSSVNKQNGAIGRTKVTYLATKVTDVHGNWVEYEYGQYGRLNRIHSNDSREITIQRDQTTGLISSVTAHPGTSEARIWNYAYQQHSANLFLDTVTLPDSRTWHFDMVGMLYSANDAYDCVVPEFDVEITHPDGMAGVFRFKEYRHRRVYVGPDGYGRTASCSTVNTETLNWFKVLSLKQKTLSGQGYPAASWTYDYSGGEATTNDANVNLTGPIWGEVTDPFGTRTRQTYKEGDFEGLVEKTEVFNGASVVQSTVFEYAAENALGTSWLENENPAKYTRPRNVTSAVLTVDGVSYTTATNYVSNQSSSNYSYSNPSSVTTNSPLVSTARIVQNTYWSDTSKWILARPKRVTRNGDVFDDYQYDSYGRLIDHNRFGYDRATYTWHTSGPAAGKLKTYKDALGREIKLEDYYRGSPQRVIRPDLKVLNREYDRNGWLKSRTTARGHTEYYDYDSVGRLTLVDRPGTLNSTSVSYGGLGAGIIQVTTSGTLETLTSYDAMLRPILIHQRPLSGGGGDIYSRYEYDSLNRETFASFPMSSPTGTTGTNTFYDTLGRTIRTRLTVAPFSETLTSYLPGNGQFEVTDPSGNTTTITRTGYGSPMDGTLVGVVQPEGVTTTLTHDVHGFPLSATQNGITQSWEYDDRYRVCAHNVPETGTKRFEYDGADQLIAYAEGVSSGCGALPLADKVAYTYDLLGRVTFVDYPTGTADISTTFDDDSNVIATSRAGADWAYTYDANNLLTGETLTIDGRVYTAGYTFNSDGYMTSYNSPGGNTFDYLYDGHGRPVRVEHQGTAIVPAQNAQYYSNGQLKQLSYGNGLSYEATLTSRLKPLRTFVRHSATNTYVTDFTYSYDDTGLITSISDGVDSAENRSYQYDDLNRLIAASGPWGNVAYAYDTNNNLKSKIFTGATSRQVNMTYHGSTNRLISYSDSDTTGGVSESYSYDARGNVQDNSRQTFTYDRANQPISATNNGVSASFVYDANYRRLKQTVNGESIYTIYNQSGAILLRDNVTTGEVTDYIRLGGRQIAEVRNGVREYIFSDHLGTPIVGVDASRNTLWRDSRTPFGERIQTVSNRSDRVGYTGHIEDSDLKLTYMKARYYDPVVGRFMSNDPVGFGSGGPAYFNRYAYTTNDPVNLTDPTGMCGTRIPGRAGTACFSFQFPNGNPVANAIAEFKQVVANENNSGGETTESSDTDDAEAEGDEIVATLYLANGISLFEVNGGADFLLGTVDNPAVSPLLCQSAGVCIVEFPDRFFRKVIDGIHGRNGRNPTSTSTKGFFYSSFLNRESILAISTTVLRTGVGRPAIFPGRVNVTAFAPVPYGAARPRRGYTPLPVNGIQLQLQITGTNRSKATSLFPTSIKP